MYYLLRITTSASNILYSICLCTNVEIRNVRSINKSIMLPESWKKMKSGYQVGTSKSNTFPKKD